MMTSNDRLATELRSARAARTLVNGLVVSKIDYCNCLLAGTPANLMDKLQSMQQPGCMWSQKIRPHHKPCETCYVFRNGRRSSYVYSQISPRLCTRLSGGTLQSGCMIRTEEPLVISCSRWSDHSENNNIVWRPTGPSHTWNLKHGTVLPSFVRAAKTACVQKNCSSHQGSNCEKWTGRISSTAETKVLGAQWNELRG
jgi:hypothetical protein